MQDNSQGKRNWRIGELAKAAGVSADTLRHYERKGVLGKPQRTANGYRHYLDDALDRVRLVRRALAVGFTLDELGRVLRIRDSGGAPCHEVRELAAEKLATVEAQLVDMLALRDELKSTLGDWDERLGGTKSGAPARLLEAFAASANVREAGTRSAAKRNLKRR